MPSGYYILSQIDLYSNLWFVLDFIWCDISSKIVISFIFCLFIIYLFIIIIIFFLRYKLCSVWPLLHD